MRIGVAGGGEGVAGTQGSKASGTTGVVVLESGAGGAVSEMLGAGAVPRSDNTPLPRPPG